MSFENRKTLIFAGWVVAVCAAAMALGATSITQWVAAALVAVIPAGVAHNFWRGPDQTMSESIHDARR
jgi:hypothetical protein